MRGTISRFFQGLDVARPCLSKDWTAVSAQSRRRRGPCWRRGSLVATRSEFGETAAEGTRQARETGRLVGAATERGEVPEAVA